MRRRAWIFCFAVLLAIVLGWRAWRAREPTAASAPGISAGAHDQAQRSVPQASGAAPEQSTLADRLNVPTSTIEADLRLLADLLDTFRSNFPQSGNPVGTNAEITATLSGKNVHRLSLVPPGHPAINPQGELCDRWGTPFFFHAESARQMGIRSAGPDRRMWTHDDVVLPP